MIKSTSYQTYQRIVTLLTKAREKRGLTIRQLAILLDTDNTTISKIEVLRRQLSLGDFIQYCEALDEDPAKILRQAMSRQKR